MRRGPAGGNWEKSPWETPCFPALAQGLHALTQETPLLPGACTQPAALGALHCCMHVHPSNGRTCAKDMMMLICAFDFWEGAGPAAGAAQGATLRMMSLGHRGSQCWATPGKDLLNACMQPLA